MGKKIIAGIIAALFVTGGASAAINTSSNNNPSMDLPSTEQHSHESDFETENVFIETEYTETESQSNEVFVPALPPIADNNSEESKPATKESQDNTISETTENETQEVLETETDETNSSEIESGELQYTLSSDGSYYSVNGLGTCTDTNILIPSEYNGIKVTTISLNAFSRCYTLRGITISENITDIQGGAFLDCKALSEIVVLDGNPVYHSSNNCLIQTENKTLIKGCKNSVIPTDGSVEIIGSQAFYGCINITDINIPECITRIGSLAFQECGFSYVNIPNSVTYIGSQAFGLCTNLTDIYYSGTMEEWNNITIYNTAFRSTPLSTIHCTDGDITL